MTVKFCYAEYYAGHKTCSIWPVRRVRFLSIPPSGPFREPGTIRAAQTQIVDSRTPHFKMAVILEFLFARKSALVALSLS